MNRHTLKSDPIKDAKKYKKALADLTSAVRAHLKAFDKIMEGKESEARGRLLAYLANQLEIANDRARYFGLGIDFRTDIKRPYGTKRGLDEQGDKS